MENYTVKLDVLTMLRREIILRKLKDKAEKKKERLAKQSKTRPPTPLKANKKNIKALLPDPSSYYSNEFPQLNIKPSCDWQRVICCFHNETKPSLGVNIVNGGFHCFSCQAKGGDVFDFHRLRYQLSFKDTLTFFEGNIF